MEYLIIIFAVIICIFIFTKIFFRKITIFEYERGIKYSKGKFKEILNPGQYFIFSYFTTVIKVDVRPRFITIMGQEVLTSDGVTLKVSLASKYEIVKPDVAINKIQNYDTAIYLILQLGLRQIIGSSKIDELMENRSSFGQRLMEITSKEIDELGLKLLSVDVKDIMFPGELKKVFSEVVKAQKEGLAALEKARGETAALRNLANAAKMMENNPALLQLRLLQSLDSSSGNTIVLGIPPTTTPLPIKTKEIESKVENPKLSDGE